MLILKKKKHSLNFNKLRKFYGLGKTLSKKIILSQTDSFFIPEKKKDLKETTEVLNKLQSNEELF